MEKIDDLIDTLSNHIKELIESRKAFENEIAENTKALAALVEARAKLY